MNLTERLGAVWHSVASNFHQCIHYLDSDRGFLLFTSDMALYTFLATSIILTIFMVISQPRNFLDWSLTLRQFVLSAVLGIGLIARWHGDRIPLWFLTLELIVLSIAGILVIIALIRDYVWFYWEQRRTE
jgi:hypothetical protein